MGAAGVMFTLDTESGFDQVVFITSAYGLGETVVQGAVNPDEFYVCKPNLDARPAGDPAQERGRQGACKMVFADATHAGESTRTVEVAADERRRFSLTDAEVEELARFAVAIEKHYGRPMDIEWGRDGDDGKLYILQARPETVQLARRGQHAAPLPARRRTSEVLATGRAIGQKIGQGAVRLVQSAAEMDRVQGGRRARHRHDRSRLGAGDEARRRRSSPTAAAAPATRRSSRASSAFPRWSAAATRPTVLTDGEEVTVSCAEGDTGHVYDGPAGDRDRRRRARPDAAGRRPRS